VVAASALQVAVDRYLRHVTIERGLSDNTLAAYRRDLAAYLDFLDSLEINTPAAITAAVVSSYSQHLGTRAEGALAASSKARMLSSVRSLHRFLLDEGDVESDVAAETKPPKLPSRLPKAITIEQMSAVLAATDGDDLQLLRDKALLELLYATGARISEVVALNVDDVLAESVEKNSLGEQTSGSVSSAEMVRLFGKGNKQRIVPVGSFARTAIDNYLVRVRPTYSLRGASTAALFLGARGARMSRQSVPTSGSRSPRILFGTPLPPTCWRAAPMCGSFRNFWGTPRWRQRSSTLWSPQILCATCMRQPTHEHGSCAPHG
jgi:integrase/recombinase XerD